jgi:hypothetical protein
VLGDLLVHQIDTGTVLRVLDPIWQTRTETARCASGPAKATLAANTRRLFPRARAATLFGHPATVGAHLVARGGGPLSTPPTICPPVVSQLTTGRRDRRLQQ